MAANSQRSPRASSDESTRLLFSPEDEENDAAILIPSSQTTELEGHEGMVHDCQWSPTSDRLASASEDGTARIWDMRGSGGNSGLVPPNVVVQSENDATPERENKDINCLDWNLDGSLLVTGSHDGFVKVWTEHGQFVNLLERHSGRVLEVKWSKEGDHVLSAGSDSAIISDVEAKRSHKFKFHNGAVMTVDWMNYFVFASGSDDNTIHICDMDAERPIKVFEGHTDTVFEIKWNPQGTLLASGSDDRTVKIWSMRYDSHVRDLQGHSNVISAVNWSPTNYLNANSMLASASWDTTARLWNVERGVCLHTLRKHTDMVQSVAFSPDGKRLATASADGFVHIWSSHCGKLISTYEARHDCQKVCWNLKGDKIGACASDGSVFVIDLRKL